MMTDAERLDWLDSFFRNCASASLMFNSAEDIEVAETIGEGPLEPGFILVADGCMPVEVNSEISIRDAIDLMRHTMENRTEDDLET